MTTLAGCSDNTAVPIRLLSFPENGRYQRVLTEAIARLQQAGFGRPVTWQKTLEQPGSGALLLLLGDHRQSRPAAWAAAGLAVDFQLVLADLGIEPDDRGGFTPEDLQLAIDGIHAVCTVTGGPTPGHHCACRR